MRPRGPPEATGAGRGGKSPPEEPPEGARPWPHRDLDVQPPVCCFKPPVCGAVPAAPGHPCTWTPLYFRDQPWQHLEERQEGSRQEAEAMPWGQWGGPGLGPAPGTEVGVTTRKRGWGGAGGAIQDTAGLSPGKQVDGVGFPRGRGWSQKGARPQPLTQTLGPVR